MKAYALTSYAAGGQRGWIDLPQSALGPGEVVITVRAMGMNPLDAMIARGELKVLLPYRLPQVLGQELAGDVVAVGANVTDFSVGDRVFTRLPIAAIGAFAEQVIVAAHEVAPMPANLSYEEAAGLPLVLLTAVQAFTEKAPLGPGSKVFIQGGVGGLGSIAIQVAKHLGAEVATTVSTANVDLARELGADQVIDYRTQSYEELLSEVDVVLDTLGKGETQRSMKVLKPGGTLVSVAGSPDPALATQLGKGYLRSVLWWLSRKDRAAAKKLGVNYTFLFMRASGEQLRAFTPALEEGSIKPLVGEVFPFEDIEKAWEVMVSGKGRPGKIVLHRDT